MHNLLRRQIQQALRDGQPDLDRLLELVDAQYRLIDEERRGTVRAMRLMSDEALALTREIRSQQDSRVQAILDHVKDVIITVDPAGLIESLNPTGERVFDYTQAEVIGQPLTRLLPVLCPSGSITTVLNELAERVEDTFLDLAPHEAEARRKCGEQFTAEMSVSKAVVSERPVYIVCLRDTTDRRQAELALKESEARYRTLVENAPEAIVVLDVDEGRFVDVNENATRFFKMDRERLLTVGPEEVSPPQQADGTPSFGIARGYIARALAGETPVFDWLHCDAEGRAFPCEVRLVRLPSSTRKLIRGSITDISERKRAELVAAGEREVFERMAADVGLETTLEALVDLIERAVPGCFAACMLLDEGRGVLVYGSAPRLPELYRRATEALAIGPANGSSGAAVAMGTTIVAADVACDLHWAGCREQALAHGLRACWAMPIKSANGSILGTLTLYFREPRSVEPVQLQLLERLARIAGLAIERQRAERALRSSEARFRELFQNVVDGVYQSSPEGRILAANPALVKMLGYPSEEALRMVASAAELYVNPKDRETLNRTLAEHGEVHNYEYCLRCADGKQIVVLENSRVVRDAQDCIVAYEGTITDITERKRAETAIFEEKEKAQVTLQSIGDAVITTDANGTIDYLNPVAEDLTGWENRAAGGRSVTEIVRLIHDTTREPIENPVVRCLREGRTIGLAEPTVLINRTGHEVAIQDSVAPIRDRNGHVIGTVMVFHDVSRERRLRRALSYQASHDALTGLINRREFENRLAQALEQQRDGDVQYALLYLDLDQFKVVNDTCGHTAGDQLLKQVTAVMQAHVRGSDLLARLGGDEFGVLLHGCSTREATRIADAIRQSIRDFRFQWQGKAMSVGVSVGVVDLANTDSVANLLSAADVACYAAKDLGRNRVHVYQHGRAPERHREMLWISRLTEACEAGRLELYFQPIVPIGDTTDRRGHFELLVRMRDEEGELISPNAFIPAAERYNLMPMIDRWVISQAVSTLAHRRDRGTADDLYCLAINLSGTSLNEDRFLEFVIDELSRHRVSPGAICFEITETAAVANLTQVVYFIRELKRLGCRFALDDFGSGLSSFNYLKTLPVDYLKIDGQFVQHVAEDQIDLSIVEAIAQVGRAMGIRTIAERVETVEVLDRLAAIGVQYAQGFYIASPEPVANFPRFKLRGGLPDLRLA